jgi:hypothetical protein
MLPVAAACIPSISPGGLGMLPTGSVGIGTKSTLPANPKADATPSDREAFAVRIDAETQTAQEVEDDILR